MRSEGAATHCALHGAFVLSGRQEANVVTTVDHAAPGGETREVFKGVAAGRSHGAFQGRITVRPGAQKVDAHQLSRNLVLGRRAAIDTKPELEIYADDVKCSHGAAVGDLDEAALFYLSTRGIGREEARHMLIEAFVREAVERVDFRPVARAFAVAARPSPGDVGGMRMTTASLRTVYPGRAGSTRVAEARISDFREQSISFFSIPAPAPRSRLRSSIASPTTTAPTTPTCIAGSTG